MRLMGQRPKAGSCKYQEPGETKKGEFQGHVNHFLDNSCSIWVSTLERAEVSILIILHLEAEFANT